MIPEDLRECLVLRRDHYAIGNEAALRRDVAEGRLTKVATGAFAPTPIWTMLDEDQRYRLVVHAAALRFPGEVFTHRSAAALWRLPILGQWPATAESTVDRTSGGRSRRGLVRYAVGVPSDTEIREGVRVGGLARTVVDCAAVSSFSTGVAFADAALHLVARDRLEDALAAGGQRRGAARAARVIAFADRLAESPGESLSRSCMEMLGFERPVLQQRFFDEAGFIGRVDFFWPRSSVVGEFDGHGKYLRAELRNGRSAAQVVVDEKRREDRLRRVVRSVVRWEWADARNPRRLGVLLEAAGVPRRQKG